MLRNTEINNLMSTVILKLMPMNAKGPNYELWTIYDQLQAWKVNVEWQYPGIGTDTSVETAQAILAKLEKLPDRELAQEIGRIVIRHTSPVLERKMKDAACGRITEWMSRANATPVNGVYTGKPRLAGNYHAAAPAAR